MKLGHGYCLQREAKGMLIVSKGACAPILAGIVFFFVLGLVAQRWAHLERRAAGGGSRTPSLPCTISHRDDEFWACYHGINMAPATWQV